MEELIHNDLQQYLLNVNEIDERLPECPDVEIAVQLKRLGYHMTQL